MSVGYNNTGGFYGVQDGLSYTPKHKLTPKDRQHYNYIIKRSTYKPKSLYTKWRKGDDFNFRNFVEHGNTKTSTVEREHKERYANRVNAYRPMDKIVGMQSMEIPRYTRMVPPDVRNSSKFWSKIKKKPEDLLLKSFRSGKNLHRTFKPGKYSNQFFKAIGNGRSDFRDEYQSDTNLPVQKYVDTHSIRNPYKIPQRKGTTTSGTVKGLNVPKFYNRHYKGVRGNLDFNNSNYNLKKEHKIFSVQNLGNDKDLMPNKALPMKSKTFQHPNKNVFPVNSSRNLDMIGNKFVKKGNKLSQMNVTSKFMVRNPFSPNDTKTFTRGTGNLIRRHTNNYIKNINPMGVMKARYHMRNNSNVLLKK